MKKIVTEEAMLREYGNPKSIFVNLFNREPKQESGIYYFGNEDDGDFFDESDVQIWRNGSLKNHWHSRALLENKISHHLVNEVIKNSSCVVDLACGPGMGLIPSIKQIDAAFPCMASDANTLVLEEWKRYLGTDEEVKKLDFAAFSVFDIPFQNNSIQAYSSYIGLSNTRHGNDGYKRALSEIYRTLIEGGMFYAIESEWNDIPAILDLFDKIGMQPWQIFEEKQISWHDRFIECGFEIAYEQPQEYRSLRKEDNELGEAAFRYGVNIGLSFNAYIVKKKGI